MKRNATIKASDKDTTITVDIQVESVDSLTRGEVEVAKDSLVDAVMRTLNNGNVRYFAVPLGSINVKA